LFVEDNRPVCIVKELPFLRRGYIATPPKLIKRLRGWYMSDPVYNMTMKATDSRDLIFSLLAICSDTKDLGVAADYIKSTREVFMNTTLALLKSGNFSILSLAQGSGNSIDLPSWVPDWSSPIYNALQGGPWGSANGSSEDTTVLGIRPQQSDFRPYSVSRGFKAASNIPNDSGELKALTVSTILLDHVQETSTPWSRDLGTYNDFVAYVDRVFQMAHQEKFPKSRYNALKQAFSRSKPKKYANSKYANLKDTTPVCFHAMQLVMI
jgi:hypothetical protein